MSKQVPSLILIIALCIAVMFAACTEKKSTTIATVDATKITAKDLKAQMKREQGLYDALALHAPETFAAFRRQALDELIQESLLLEEANRKDISLNPEEVQALETSLGTDIPDEAVRTWKEAQKRRALIKKLIEQEVLASIPIPEKEITGYYQKHIADFQEHAKFHARQILLDKRETAEKLHARLMKGEDFAQLAREFSQSPDRERGGDLGFFDASSYPESFVDICRTLKPGEISQVIASPYGYQIFQLLEKRPARKRSLAEVSDEIKRQLQEAQVESAYLSWLDGLLTHAKISINEKALKEVQLEDS